MKVFQSEHTCTLANPSVVYFHPELPPSQSPRSCLLKFLERPGKFLGPAKPFLDSLYLKTEVYMPETSRMKRTSVHIKNMRIKQCRNHRVWDFAMAFQPSAKTSQTFEKRAPGPSCSKAGWHYPPFEQPGTEVTGYCFKSSNSSQLFRSVFVALIKIIGTLTYRDKQIWMIAPTIHFQNILRVLTFNMKIQILRHNENITYITEKLENWCVTFQYCKISDQLTISGLQQSQALLLARSSYSGRTHGNPTIC